MSEVREKTDAGGVEHGCGYGTAAGRLIRAAAALALSCSVSGVASGATTQTHAPDPQQIASRNVGKELLNELAASGHRLVLASRGAPGTGDYELYVSKADGTDHLNITNTPDEDESRPRVNRKTGRIAFVTCAYNAGQSKPQDSPPGFLAFIDKDGGNREKTKVDQAADKCWSPDGAKLAMSWPSRTTRGFRIYDPETKQIQTFAQDRAGMIDIDWSPDGKLLAIGSRKEMGFRYTILTMNTDGTGMRMFHGTTDVDWPYPYCHPCWHPTEMRLAWNSQQGLLVADYNPEDGKSKNVRSIVSFKDVGWEDPSPRWSPDGAYIAYLSRSKRLCVVRVADSAWAELAIPAGWKMSLWDYDWLVKDSE